MKRTNPAITPEEFSRNEAEMLKKHGIKLMHTKKTALEYLKEWPEDAYFTIIPVGAGPAFERSVKKQD